MLTTHVSLGSAKENHEVLAAESGWRHRIDGLVATSQSGAVLNFHRQDGTTLMPLVISPNTTVVVPITRDGWAETDAGEPLLLNTTNDAQLVVRHSLTR